VREITGLDDNSINQTIEACKDDTGRYSLEQVISLLFDDNVRVLTNKKKQIFDFILCCSFEIIFNDYLHNQLIIMIQMDLLKQQPQHYHMIEIMKIQ
jgi:hypothetical protein